MKILIVYKSSGLSDNPFVRLLAESIRACGHEVVCSVEEFWQHADAYDVVHFQWPEEVFGWKYPDATQVTAFANQLHLLQKAKIPIVYTRHNTRPHKGDKQLLAAYRMLENEATAVVHMGNPSCEEFLSAHPKSKQRQEVIPHHIYEGLYESNLTREEARRQLHIAPNRLVILSFGAFRHEEERRLVWGAFRRLHHPRKYLLAPRLCPYTLHDSFRHGWKRTLEQALYWLAHLSESVFSCQITSPDPLISDEELPAYFLAADVVFIQRLNILNSGNVPLGFSFGRVVVGPNCGNTGEWLTQSGNPTFDPNDPKSVDQALQRAAELSVEGMGATNREWVYTHCRLSRVAADYIRLYQEIYDREHK